MKNRNYKKYLTVALLAVVLCVALGSNFALAAAPAAPANPQPQSYSAPGKTLGVLNCVTDLTTCLIYGVSYAINEGLQILINAGAAIIDWGLGLDQNVATSTTVQNGFSASLAIANLGFVLGIIIIALATILRRESYGIKKLLWKVVVMAIFVNFGLVVTAPIIGFSDSLSNYFVQQATGGNSDFGLALTSAFAPQSLFSPPVLTPQIAASKAANTACTLTVGASLLGLNPLYAACNAITKYLTNGQVNPASAGSDAIWQQILSLLFSAVFAAIIAFTFLTIGILLVMRYLWLGFLLIILPLAWLTWIFPKFSDNFTKWWGHFIRWAFFPAISLFFIYLAMSTVQFNASGQNPPTLNIPSSTFSTGSSSGNNPSEFLMLSTGQSPSVIQTMLDQLLLVGLCLGGLIAANSLSITGADIAIKTGKSAAGAVGGYVGKQGKKGAAKVVPQKAKNALQEGRAPFIPRPIQSWMGRGLGNVEHAGTSALVDKEAGWAKEKMKDPKEADRLLAGSLNKEQRLALLKAKSEGNKLKPDAIVDGRPLVELIDDKKFFESSGQEHLYKELNNRFGSSPEARRAAKAIAAGIEKVLNDAGEEVNAKELLKQESEKTAALPQKDLAKVFGNALYGQNDKKGNRMGMKGSEADILAESLVDAIQTKNPTRQGTFLPEMNWTSIQNYQGMTNNKLGGLISEAKTQLEKAQKAGDANSIKVAEDSVRALQKRKSIFNDKLIGGTMLKAGAPHEPHEEEHGDGGHDKGGGGHDSGGGSSDHGGGHGH